jgi:23S rRNA (cytosine1962-C5)-methyltransferase
VPDILSLTPAHFHDYELLDSGGYMKLERFGKYITIRPEPQAVWDPQQQMPHWENSAHVRFVARSSSSGDWKKLRDMPDQWQIQYEMGNGGRNAEYKGRGTGGEGTNTRDEGRRTRSEGTNTKDEGRGGARGEGRGEYATLRFRLGLTSFKHVGIFPEQAVNWEYITESMSMLKVERPKFLNLFAYTGGASLAARAAGAETTHLDSIKQVVSWANENMQLSDLDHIRWVVEDALKFVKRETKRGNKYHGIILDPPAFGHGPTGEKWKLEDNINEMMKHVLDLLDPHQHFLILNAYSLGFSSMILENLVRTKANANNLEIGELYLKDKYEKKLPLGAFARFRSVSNR